MYRETVGPALTMAIRARDETRDAFEKVERKAIRLGSTLRRTVSSVGSLMMSFATLGRVTGLLSEEHARLIGVFGTISRVITTVYTVATTIATAADWSHVTALTWKISLMTLGIGVAIAAAAAMAFLAMQTREAAEATREYTEAVEEQEVRTRSIYRAGEEELLRRGVEG